MPVKSSRRLPKGYIRVHPDAEIHSVLASDGGDGFLNAVSEKVDAEEITVASVDPLNRQISAVYLLDRSTGTAYIELAKASGLELLKEAERDALRTSTFGTGLQIRHAIDSGATEIYLGLGGSATNDAGTGIAKALGYRFSDVSGNELAPIGANLHKIAAIEKPEEPTPWKNVRFFAVNDVDNPLFGERGAAHVYAEQKGADAEGVIDLDKGLRHLASVVEDNRGTGSSHKNAAHIPGAGAAGGTAYGLQMFLNAEFVSGIDFVLELAKVDQLLAARDFDYLITGEGKFDQQTLHGKLIKGVVHLGKRHHLPVIAVCGQLDVDSQDLRDFGLQEVLEIKDASKSIQYSMENAAKLIAQKIFYFFKNKASTNRVNFRL